MPTGYLTMNVNTPLGAADLRRQYDVAHNAQLAQSDVTIVAQIPNRYDSELLEFKGKPSSVTPDLFEQMLGHAGVPDDQFECYEYNPELDTVVGIHSDGIPAGTGESLGNYDIIFILANGATPGILPEQQELTALYSAPFMKHLYKVSPGNVVSLNDYSKSQERLQEGP